jgi:cell fate (sporulation/competence/biofilm development) regulator YlbF (YheA/YmcA/DUF963 family)
VPGGFNVSGGNEASELGRRYLERQPDGRGAYPHKTIAYASEAIFAKRIQEVYAIKTLGGIIMNVIDKAHELARAIKDSSEVSDITSAMKVIEADPESKVMLDNFRQNQIELQQRMMSGEMPPQEEMEKMEKLFEVLNLNLGIRRLFDAERRLSVVIEDVNKIITDSLSQMYSGQ